MQGLQWSVLLSAVVIWSASATAQLVENQTSGFVYDESVLAERVDDFSSFTPETGTFQRVHRVRAPGSSFIKLHFSRFVLPEGVTVLVHNASATETYRYSAQKRDPMTIDGAAGDDGFTSFSAMSISGDEAIVSIFGRIDRFDPSIHRLEIDSYIQGSALPGADGPLSSVSESKSAFSDSIVESTCGVNERYDAVCYRDSDPALYDRSKPVVVIITSKGKVCTGWRVGENNHLFTAEHCLGSQEDLDGAEIWFNYRATSCGGAATTSEVKVTGGELLASNHTYDYSLFTVNDFSSVSQFGYLGLDVRNGSLGEGIFIPQHGLGQPKQLAVESDMNPGGRCQIDDADHYGYESGSDIGYFCDTTTSSSGSPVISSETGKVIALHHLGGCFNSGTKIAKIWPQVSSYFDGVVPKADSAWDFEPSNQVPQADFDISCDKLSCELNASSSNDPDGEIIEFSWSLGDGTTASGSMVIHEFTAAGEYEISLEVEDDEGATDRYTQTVNVTVPNQAPEARFSTQCVETSCSFDASSSEDPDGSIESWDWTLGDGAEASGTTVEYIYAEEGTYSVRLTVRDAEGASDIKTHTVQVNVPNKPPTASFEVTCDELDCNFDAGDSSDPDGQLEDYRWAFGDGNGASGRQVTHRYADDSEYTITLTVQDDEKATDKRSETIQVETVNEGPAVQFTYSCEGKVCTFEGSSTDTNTDNDSVSYEWDFGDGNTAEGLYTVHEFDRSGHYPVQLKAVDSAETSATKTRRVRVKPPELKLDVSRARQAAKPIVTLSWTGAESDRVKIYRDGELLFTARNDGKFTDLDPVARTKPANYVLCESDTTRCTDKVPLAF
jgi:PKD repeat protein